MVTQRHWASHSHPCAFVQFPSGIMWYVHWPPDGDALRLGRSDCEWAAVKNAGIELCGNGTQNENIIVKKIEEKNEKN